MGNAVNKISRTIRLSDFLTGTITDGTWSDVIETAKSDRADFEASASHISEYAGQIWANLVDDSVLRSYALYYKHGKVWKVDDSTARDALGSQDLLELNDLLIQSSDATLWQCTVTASTSSSWTEINTGVPADHHHTEFSGSLALTGSLFAVGVVFSDQATTPVAPASTQSVLWVSGATKQALMFTADDSQTFQVAGPGTIIQLDIGSAVTGTNNTNTSLPERKSSSGATGKPFLSYRSGSDSAASWTFNYPGDWPIGGTSTCNMHILYGGDADYSGSIRRSYNFTRLVVGEQINALNGSTFSGDITFPGTSDRFYEEIINVSLDSAVYGDVIRLYLERDANNAADTYSGSWEVYNVSLRRQQY